MLAENLNYGDTFINKHTGKEVKVGERNGERVFISEDGDIFDFIDEDLYKEVY